MNNVTSSHRVIVPYERNTTFSTSQKYDNQADLDQAIRDHADARLRVESIAFFAMKGLAVIETGPIDIKVKVKSAYLQMGQGSEGYQAAHVSAAAGRVDNLSQWYANQIEAGTPLTPMMKKTLRILGLSTADMNVLKDRTDPVKIEGIIKRLKAKKHVFHSTLLDHLINATHNLPYEVNLSTDKGLERVVRKILKSLFRMVMRNEITPERAINIYRKAILAHFAKIDKEFTARIENLNASPSSSETTASIRRYSRLQSYALLEYAGTKNFDLNRTFGKYDPDNQCFLPPNEEDREDILANYVFTEEKNTQENKEPDEDKENRQPNDKADLPVIKRETTPLSTLHPQPKKRKENKDLDGEKEDRHPNGIPALPVKKREAQTFSLVHPLPNKRAIC